VYPLSFAGASGFNTADIATSNLKTAFLGDFADSAEDFQ
jgi:hypothetical protein